MTLFSEAELRALSDGPDTPLAAALDLLDEERTKTRVLDDTCDRYGLPHDAAALCRHIENSRTFVAEVDRASLDLALERLAAAQQAAAEATTVLERSTGWVHCDSPSVDRWTGQPLGCGTCRACDYRRAVDRALSRLAEAPAPEDPTPEVPGPTTP